MQMIQEVMKEYGSLFRYEIMESKNDSDSPAPKPPSPRSCAGPLAAECMREGTADELLGTTNTAGLGTY